MHHVPRAIYDRVNRQSRAVFRSSFCSIRTDIKTKCAASVRGAQITLANAPTIITNQISTARPTARYLYILTLAALEAIASSSTSSLTVTSPNLTTSGTPRSKQAAKRTALVNLSPPYPGTNAPSQFSSGSVFVALRIRLLVTTQDSSPCAENSYIAFRSL
nr:hypothetical protein CFP56_04136 [Quercus suber]